MIKLNSFHREILNHRLDVPDAICESLDRMYDEIAIECDTIKSIINQSESITKEQFTESQIEILIDCLEGCTIFAGMKDAIVTGELSKGKAMQFHKCANELEREFDTECNRS